MKYLVLLACFLGCTAAAQTLNWAAHFKGPAHNSCTDLVTDAQGNVYAVGIFKNSVDFDPSSQVLYLNEGNAGAGDMFCVKFNRNGQLIWAKIVGGAKNYSSTHETTPRIALDHQGNLIVSGIYQNTVDLNPGPGSFYLPAPSPIFSTGNFISKLTPEGNLIWATNYGGHFGASHNRALTVDSQGNIFLAGYFIGDFPVNDSQTLQSTGSKFDGYLVKFNSQGEALFGQQFGTTQYDDNVHSVAVNADGDYAITGSFSGAVAFQGAGESPYILQSQSNSADSFIAKYTSDGQLLWANAFGSTNTNSPDVGHKVLFDSQGNLLASGSYTNTVDFNPAPDQSHELTSIGSNAIYVAKFDAAGEFNWAKSLYAQSVNLVYQYNERVYDMALDANDAVYIIGEYLVHMDADPNEGYFGLHANGGSRNLFQIVLSDQGEFIWAQTYGSSVSNYSAVGYAIEVNTFGELVSGGSFQGTVNFNPSGTAMPLTGDSSNHAALLFSVAAVNLATVGVESPRALIYPNPAKDLVHLEVPQLEKAILYNLQGQLIAQTTTAKLDVSALAKGVYILQLTTSTGVHTTQLLVD